MDRGASPTTTKRTVTKPVAPRFSTLSKPSASTDRSSSLNKPPARPSTLSTKPPVPVFPRKQASNISAEDRANESKIGGGIGARPKRVSLAPSAQRSDRTISTRADPTTVPRSTIRSEPLSTQDRRTIPRVSTTATSARRIQSPTSTRTFAPVLTSRRTHLSSSRRPKANHGIEDEEDKENGSITEGEPGSSTYPEEVEEMSDRASHAGQTFLEQGQLEQLEIELKDLQTRHQQLQDLYDQQVLRIRECARGASFGTSRRGRANQSSSRRTRRATCLTRRTSYGC